MNTQDKQTDKYTDWTHATPWFILGAILSFTPVAPIGWGFLLAGIILCMGTKL